MNNKLHHKTWLDNNLNTYKGLTTSVTGIIENLLNKESIDYLAISGRTKDIKSCLEKIGRKGYKDISSQMTDISGIRIIVYFDKETHKTGDLLEKYFDIDQKNSEDKKDSLDTNKIGYRSMHYICELGKDRCNLPEYSEFEGLKFEIQVRTVLQHAWAELAHDRGYKFSTSLPKKLERKLYLYAGMLELADSGFDDISQEIDAYKSELDNKRIDDFEEISIDSVSLQSFFNNWLKNNNINTDSIANYGNWIEELVIEIKGVNINSIGELSSAIPEGYSDKLREYLQHDGHSFSMPGIIRDWLLNYDHELLLNNVNINWLLDEESYNLIELLLGEDKAQAIRRSFLEKDLFVN